MKGSGNKKNRETNKQEAKRHGIRHVGQLKKN
jgi:hypothetical protein